MPSSPARQVVTEQKIHYQTLQKPIAGKRGKGNDISVDLLTGRRNLAEDSVITMLEPKIPVLGENIHLGSVDGLEGSDRAVDLLARRRVRSELAVNAVLQPEVAVSAEHEDVVRIDRLKPADVLVD